MNRTLARHTAPSRRTLSIWISGGLLTAFAATVCAEELMDSDADTVYFHPAASLYIHGDGAGASNLVVRGLHQFPNDAKLLRLKELLEQQQQNEQNQDDQQQDEQNPDQQQDEQNQDQQQDEQNQDQQQDDRQQEQNPDQQQNPDEQQQDNQQPNPQRAEEMTQDEAEQLLDAMKQEEENKRLQLHPILGAPVKVDKDW
jgi:outer membrane biosynthesis protein TonB